MRASAGGNLRRERLARKNEGRDEAAAKRFAEAWFLPAELLCPERVHEGDEELAEASRQDWERIRARWERLRRRPVEPLAAPPRWSAGWEYEVRLQEEPPMTLQIMPRGREVAKYQFLVTRCFEDTAFQIWADLCALTPRGLSLKYAPDALRLGRPVEIP